MSGWEGPDPPQPEPAPTQPEPAPAPDAPPTSYWARSQEADGLGPGALIRSGWRLYRSVPKAFLLAAAIPGLIGILLSLPSLALGVAAWEAIVDTMADFMARSAADPNAYSYADSVALQAELQARMQAALAPQAAIAGYTAIAGGVAFAIGWLRISLLTALALGAAAGRPISVGRAFRLVVARRALVWPIIAIAIGWAAVSLAVFSLQSATDFQAWAGAPGSPRSVLIETLVAVGLVIVAIGALVLAVRWALYVPTVLAEGLGVASGVARATELGRGIRIRLALAAVGVLVLEVVSVGIVGAIVAVVVGISAGSVAVAIATYLGVTLIGNVLWAPLLPAMLALAYREMSRTRPAASSVTPGGPAERN